MDVPSTDNQSIEGCGLPDAEQSNHPPDEFENSSFGGGSITKAGPRRWESKALLKSEKKERKKRLFFKIFQPTTCYSYHKKKILYLYVIILFSILHFARMSYYLSDR